MIGLASAPIVFGYRTWTYAVFRRLAARPATDDAQSGGDAYPSYTTN
jgi:hypothetical protein